jgi:probable HAF family extracellular repeat protein
MRHAFRFDGLTMHDLGVTGGTGSSGGFDITDTGLITGGSITEGGAKHAFFYDGLEMHDLGTLGGFVSEGRGINAAGAITGFSFTAGFVQHAFRWDGAIMHDLGTLGGQKSFGNGINDDGLIVGTSDVDETTLTHAFVWDGAMHDLNDLLTDLPPGVTIELQNVQYGGSINASGQIAATGRYLTAGPGPFASRAFLLTPVPVPESATATAMGTASAALAGIAIVRRRGAK